MDRKETLDKLLGELGLRALPPEETRGVVGGGNLWGKKDDECKDCDCLDGCLLPDG